jgi:hypothetical protein
MHPGEDMTQIYGTSHGGIFRVGGHGGGVFNNRLGVGALGSVGAGALGLTDSQLLGRCAGIGPGSDVPPESRASILAGCKSQVNGVRGAARRLYLDVQNEASKGRALVADIVGQGVSVQRGPDRRGQGRVEAPAAHHDRREAGQQGFRGWWHDQPVLRRRRGADDQPARLDADQ